MQMASVPPFEVDTRISVDYSVQKDLRLGTYW